NPSSSEPRATSTASQAGTNVPATLQPARRARNTVSVAASAENRARYAPAASQAGYLSHGTVIATSESRAIQCTDTKKNARPKRYPVLHAERSGRSAEAARSSPARSGTSANHATNPRRESRKAAPRSSPETTAANRRRLGELHLFPLVRGTIDGVHQLHHREDLLRVPHGTLSLAERVREVRDLRFHRLLV